MKIVYTTLRENTPEAKKTARQLQVQFHGTDSAKESGKERKGETRQVRARADVALGHDVQAKPLPLTDLLEYGSTEGQTQRKVEQTYPQQNDRQTLRAIFIRKFVENQEVTVSYRQVGPRLDILV
jgi:hypothetical protein